MKQETFIAEGDWWNDVNLELEYHRVAQAGDCAIDCSDKSRTWTGSTEMDCVIKLDGMSL